MLPCLLLYVSLLGLLVGPPPAFGGELRFELIHSSHPEVLERVARRAATEVSGDGASFSMPLSSGSYAGTGQYFVRFKVGTPAQKFLLVSDTGSDLTWMNCRYRCRNCSKFPRRRTFHADLSASFSPITCASDACKFSLPFSLASCPTPVSPCAYEYEYADGSAARGFFANESVTVVLSTGQKKKLRGVLIGCSANFEGSSFRVADGVLGLGYSSSSFASAAARHFGGKFSYCLVDHLSPKNVTSYLTFGSTFASHTVKHFVHYIPLILDRRLNPFYAVNVTGISVGGRVLPIPQSVWDASERGQGGLILDSGSSLTTWAEPAYTPVFKALSSALTQFSRTQAKPFDFCIKVGPEYTDSLVPSLVLHFEGGTRFEPPVKSYLIDVAAGVKCIGFLSTPFPGTSTLGNIMMQNHRWEFDLVKEKLGFMPSTCQP